MTQKQPVPTWLDETARLLRERHSYIRLATIAKECEVSVAWLSKLQTGKLITAPINKIQRVNTWLKDHANV